MAHRGDALEAEKPLEKDIRVIRLLRYEITPARLPSSLPEYPRNSVLSSDVLVLSQEVLSQRKELLTFYPHRSFFKGYILIHRKILPWT